MISDWNYITSAPKDGTVLLLFHKDWKDEDFNPSGVVEGFFQVDHGWIVTAWNSCQDCWDTQEFAEPSHWSKKVGPLECDHNMVYQGHGHNYSVYKCLRCGLEEER